MNYFWRALLLLLILMIIGFFLCRHFICNPLIPVGADTCNTWNVDDDKNEIFDIGNNVNFLRSQYNHMTQYATVNDAIGKTAQYLINNPTRSLLITGLYDTLEINNHNLLPNLGLARADDVKSWIEAQQVPSNQIQITSKISDNCYDADTLRRGIEFDFRELKSDDQKIAAIKERLFGKPLMLYFSTGSDNPNITSQLRTDFSDLFYYLDNVSGSRLDIDGHTDNAGNANANMTLSQNRADDVRNYISQNGGVATNLMDTQGYGPNNPIAPNDTPANMALNRRVEVTLK